MSDLPPDQAGTNNLPPAAGGPVPPPVFAGYTRPGQTMLKFGPDQLQSLAEGYFSLNWVFLFGVLWVIAGEVVLVITSSNQSSARNDDQALLFGLSWIIFLAATVVVIAFASYGSCKKIGFGLGWTPMGCRLAAMLLGINSFFCFGLIGAVIVQTMAANEIRKYGVPTRFMGGLKKKDIKAAIDAMRASPQFQAQQAAESSPL